MARHDDDEGRVRGDRWPRRSHEDPDDDEWYEPRVMEFAKKIVRQGAEVVWSTQGALREKASGVRSREIPKELVESVAHLTTRTKDELVGLMAREFKSYLEKMDLAGELRKVAENYTLDVNMKIRLKPNDGYKEPEGMRSDGSGESESEPESEPEPADTSDRLEPEPETESESERSGAPAETETERSDVSVESERSGDPSESE